MTQLPPEVLHLIDSALSEDQAFNDPTTHALVPAGVVGIGKLRAKSPGVLAGVGVALEVFRRVDPQLSTRVLLEDGANPCARGRNCRDRRRGVQHSPGGKNGLELSAADERHRQRHQSLCPGDRGHPFPGSWTTRKTAPGHRFLDKYAVRMGGATTTGFIWPMASW